MSLKVGDRIYCFGAYKNVSGGFGGGTWKTKGTIVNILDEYVDFKASDGCVFFCHIKQVRKIKERKRIWVNEYENGLRENWYESKEKADAHKSQIYDRIRCVEFVEVRKK